MPKIIYKQQHVGDNGRKFSASRNSHYVKYIGEREHVLKTSHETNLVKYMGEREHAAKFDNADHTIDYDITGKHAADNMAEYNNGLFGYINGKFSDKYSTSEMQKYVRKISTPHRNVFHSVFSFTPESAVEAGLNTLDDWENWVKYHISDIANCMNMKIENIEYLAAVHLKEGQPHVHIIWWDKQQQVLINKVNPIVCDNIRIAAIKSTYHDQFVALHNNEDKLIRKLRSDIADYAASSLAEIPSDVYSRKIIAGIEHIHDIIPKKGRTAYKYMPAEVKKEIDILSHFIIDNNPDFRSTYEEICELRRLYNEMLHSDETNYGKLQLATFMGKINDEIESSIGNAILKLIMKEQKAGHWNTSADNSFQAHNDTELPHDEAPPFFNDEPDSNNDLPHGEAPVSRKLYISSFAIREARNAVKDKDYDRALELFSKEADKGNILAKYEIADLCRRNLCQGNAFEIYREALNGFLEIEPRTSQKAYVHYRIGRMFYDGYGTDIDYEEAFKWLKKAADEGNHLSEFIVGKMLCNGTGAERDTEAGTEYLTRAANSGNEYAQNYLDSRTSWEQGCVVKLVGSVGRLLSENLESSRAAMAECSSAVFGHGDLSKEQIRELILKKQDKENTAEM